MGSFPWREMLFFHDTLHIFHHHNRIIHHNTDGENQTEQRQHVQREPEDQHESECPNQRNRYRYRRYQRCAPILQGEEHHQDDKEQRLEQGLIDFVDGLGNIFRHIEGEVIFQAFREVLADFLHGRLHFFSHFQRIGSRQHIDTQDGGILPVDTALGIVGRSLQ